MKVVLLKDVPKVGRKYEIRDVSDGYGRNFLLRNNLAEIATAKSEKMVEELRTKAAAARQAEEAGVQAELEKLSKVELKLKGKANAEGHLFAGIKAEDLSQAIKEQAGLSISAEYINIDKPIKTAGQYDIEAAVGGKKAKFKLLVEAE